MKNKVDLVGEVFNNVGKNWVRVLFNLQYNFSLKDTKDIINYLNNADINYNNWELDNVGNNYNAILLRGKDGFGNTKYLILESEKEV